MVNPLMRGINKPHPFTANTYGGYLLGLKRELRVSNRIIGFSVEKAAIVGRLSHLSAEE